MRVACVFERFPLPSETFALREIECLRRNGVKITVLCVEQCGNGPHSSVHLVAAPATLGGPWLRGLVYLLIHRWRRLPRFAILWWVIAVHSPRQAVGLLRDLGSLGTFLRTTAAERFDHVHGYWLGRPARLAVALSALANVPISLSGHAKDIFMETALLDTLVSRAAFVAVCNEQGLRRLQETLRPSWWSKLHLIRHGLLPEEMAPPAEQNLAVRPTHVVAVGRLVAKKGFDVLIRAFARVRDRHKDALLTVVGDGPLRKPLEALVHHLGLERWVCFTGWLAHNDAINVIGHSRVMTVPSVIAGDGDRDGTPNVILEAFSCGTPVVASRLPGIEEAIEHEESGLLVPPGDPESLAKSISRLLEDRTLTDGLARRGHQILETRFSAMANSKTLVALFHGTIGYRD